MARVKKEQPVGIFDSGIGGLTVAHAIKELMPEETLIYFGDTAHLPYGDKSEAAIQAYSIRIADVLLKKQCKVIVIACNSASSAAYELLREYVQHSVEVINVIDPMVNRVIENFSGKNVGLIGTKRTIQSGIYARKFEAAGKGIKLHSLAAPLLVPMIEEGFFNNNISHDIIEKYLMDPILKNIDALILGCTHYPLIRKEINDFYKGRVAVLDSSEAVATALYQHLKKNNLLNAHNAGQDQFLVTDYTESFEASTKLFFQQAVHLEKHPLWN
ncbi:MAG TPA: glutamate racemase [Cyclobacteriaceae bacterium]|nr:glutamate racemase [Cyclobacteriaceae bacterium]